MNGRTTAQTVVIDEATGLAAVRALAPRIAGAGEEIDGGRRLPPWLVTAMVEAGLFRVALPRSVGGAEVDVLTLLSLAEALGRADGSTGWCFVQGTLSAAQVVGFLPPETAEEIFGGAGQNILANGTGPGGTAMAAPGGYRLSGRWSFASGCTHATWFKGLARVVQEDGEAVRRPDGTAEQRTMLFPAAPELLEDNWQVSGLRGTGSQTIVVDNLFVPDERTASLTHDRQRESGALYHLPSSGVAAASFSSVAMGIARGALDAFVELAAHKTPRAGSVALREDAVVQAQVAQAEARLRGARAFLREVAGDAWETLSAGQALTERQRALLRLASTHGTQDAAGVVDVVYHAAGATAIFATQGFERRFRDVHAITQQIQAHQAHYQAVGRHFLGLAVESNYV